jgi:hypothetical protein
MIAAALLGWRRIGAGSYSRRNEARRGVQIKGGAQKHQTRRVPDFSPEWVKDAYLATQEEHE